MAATERGTGFYSKLEIESADERLERKWSAMRALVQKGWENSGEFRARMERVGLEPGDIKGLEDWDKIPTFSKKDLIGFQRDNGLAGMLSCAIGELGRVYMSPGPIFDPEAREDDYWGWTEGFYAAGFRKNDLVQMTFSYHLTPAGLMLEEPLRKIGCAVIPAGPGNTGVQIELMTLSLIHI